ncbi:ArsR/SmtB family transcription factor [Crocosphaera watsonii]|uniref:Cadmium efflux system accessory protein n=2 Tax=Crocosphaera watsonii TaxID=263511 RepID=T2JA70_CROWT|nr:metalloregulator ArsR/SmtB family transcription factor [Crocosphaera watsonii]CCQ51670.1 Cadmium efflux system accessory protein [Crocosphaera watsonii WH 8502]CCQ61362.1 Cadmium efflux system accessory protein [Crocosphaera watsonii WH 0401]
MPVSKTKADDIYQVRCFNTELVTQIRETLPSEDTLEEMTVIFNALADRSRIQILYALRNGDELCVCDIAAMLNVKIATASHHLRKMRDLKLLKYRNDGKLAYYSLRDKRVTDILSYSLPNFI